MSKKIISLFTIFFLMLFTLVACGSKGKITIQVETEMKVGETYQVKYELENIDESVELSWKVSDTGMAELNSEKLTVKALKEGTFTLTVTAKTGEVASKEIKVVKGETPLAKYTITYELNGGKAESAPTEYDGTKDVVLPTPTKEGYKFLGWYEKADFSGNAISKISKGETGNKTFYAKWEELETVVKYTITLELNGGKTESAPTEYDGTVDVVLPTPEFAGYKFSGWYDNAEFTGEVVEKIVSGSTGDKAFYAKWQVIEYTITFELAGGVLENAPTVYTVESQEIVLPTPSKEGYKFEGWYEIEGTPAEKIVAGSTGDKTFYAKWKSLVEPKPEGVYSISYELNGGTLLNEPTEYDGTVDVYLFSPLKYGYSFGGWYNNPEFSGNRIGKIAAGSTGDVKLYAKWNPTKYVISYELNGGTWGETSSPNEYTIEDEIVLVAPVNGEIGFLGWYDNPEFTGLPITKIAAGSKGDITLYAKWDHVHTEETIPGYDATCTTPGLTDGTKCSSCGEILVEQVEIPAPGHNYVDFECSCGELDKANLEVFVEELLEIFKKDNLDLTNATSSEKTTIDNNPINRESFKGTSHPHIKYVWNQKDNLKEYKWFFKFALEEITAAATANNYTEQTTYLNTKEMLEKLIAGDTTAIGGSYANGRTLFRWWIQGLINETIAPAEDIYIKCMVDYSEKANLKRFLIAYYENETHQHTEETIPGYDVTCTVPGLTDGTKCSECGEILVEQVEIPAPGHNYVDGSCTECGEADPNNEPENPDGVIYVGETRTYKTLAQALAVAEDGDTIILDAGTYTDELTITVPNLTIVGPNQGVKGQSTQRVEEAVIDGLTNINAAGVKIDGIKFTKAIKVGANDTEITNCYITPTATVACNGNNRQGCIVDSANISDLVVSNCYFDVPGTANSYTTQFMSFTNITNLTFTGNYVTNSAHTTASGSYAATRIYNVGGVLNITENEFYWGTTGYLMIIGGSSNTCTEINIIDNIIDNNGKIEDTAGISIRYGTSDLTTTIMGNEISNCCGSTLLFNSDTGSTVNVMYNNFGVGTVYKTGSKGSANITFTSNYYAESTQDPETTLEATDFDTFTHDTSGLEAYKAAYAAYLAGNDPNNIIYVGAERTYKTLAEALAVAKAGNVIILDAGTYEGAEITVENLTIKGPNAGINPVKGTRVAEAIINTDMAISASGVVIDGIQLTASGRISAGTTAIDGLTVTNVYFYQTLHNSSSQASSAPFFLSGTALIKNVEITNVKIAEQQDVRRMVIIGDNIQNLTIKDSEFISTRGSYNDAIKLGNTTAVSGEIEISNNRIENFYQYAIWFCKYAEGNYVIENNTIVNCGYDSGSSCGIRFQKYTGATTGISNIKANYNTVDNSYMLIRIDANTGDGRTAETQDVKVNYNKLLNCGATYYVKNSQSYNIDATNNYYAVAPTASLMLNAIWEPYYANIDDVPNYGDPLNIFKIEYVTDGGEFEGTAPATYDSNVGLASLPVIAKEGYVFEGWLLNGEIVTEIAAGTTGKVTLTAKYREDAIYVSKNGESYAFTTITEALAEAMDGDTIIILAGEYNENITISVPNLTIKSLNAGINPNTATRGAEAVLTGTVTIATAAKNVTIDGLAFTTTAKVLTTQVYGLTFQNNYVHDTSAPTAAWQEGTGYVSGFVSIGETATSQNVEFINNRFENVPDVNVNISDICNVSFEGNVFKNFGYDAIRFDDSSYNYGLMSFTNNEFVNDQPSGYNGIYFRSYGGPGSNDNTIIIKGNKFVNIGNATNAANTLYVNAISARNNQEHGTVWTISDNYFENCYNYIRLRNNGTVSNHTNYLWACTVENNQFIGLPTSYYFAVWNASDSNPAENPETTVFGANYYEDNNKAVISDLSAYSTYFKNVATYGTALGAKPTDAVIEPLEFWTITYELNGGTATGLVEYYHKDSGVIALPTPTWNIYHEFKQWTLNGQPITEIPTDAEGDLVIIAEWTEIDGDPATLTFELNGGNWSYGSFADISADLLADYNAFGGTNYTAATLPTGAWVNINIHNFFYSEGMKAKWSWLAGWLGEVGGSANKAGCKALLDYNDAASFAAKNSNYIYEVSYEFRAIMRGSSITSNASYKTPDYSDVTLNDQIWEPLNAVQSTTIDTTVGKVMTLPQAYKVYLSFVGWYDNPEFTGEPITTYTVAEENPTFYAKFEDLNPVTAINISNPVEKLVRYETHQLQWEVLPATTANKGVLFVSTNEKVATVDTDGLITTIANGTTTIKVVSAANETVYAEFTLEVYSPLYLTGSYVTESYLNIGEEIELKASVANGTGNIVWSSSDPSIATVTDGVVIGVKAGVATITAQLENDPESKLEFVVTVLKAELSDVVKFILANHNSNIFTSYNLGIGSGTPGYYADIYGSVSKILLNKELEISTHFLANGNATGNYYENSNLETQYGGLQFITFHYTAGMDATSDNDNTANYMTTASAGVSIHYVTGNKGNGYNGSGSHEVYQALDHAHGAWHAGDSNSRYYSNSTNLDESGLKRFEWIPTGVAYDGRDLLDVEWTASNDFYFEINGQKTTIKLPDTYNYKERNTDHIYNADGTISSQDDLTFSWAKFANRTPESFFNDQGFAVTVIGGEYYMGPTWWSYGQVIEGRICAVGGNQNSIGIESCVNEGSDLWYTWQISAKLIAKLLTDNNLTIDRVKGHHFFDGKDCPQPMLENDLEIWYEFIELIKAEKAIINEYKDYEITMVSNNTEIVDENGRVTAPEYTTSVSYTITISQNGQVVDTITLASMIPGIYEK